LSTIEGAAPALPERPLLFFDTAIRKMMRAAGMSILKSGSENPERNHPLALGARRARWKT
jgi:hypothetical protein